MSYRSLGREQFLYSLKLERYLALVDDDGARSRDKLLYVQPLTDLDKRRWIAFLVVQMLRTPSFMLQTTDNIKRILMDIAPDYLSTPGALKAAYETLFVNNDVYTRFHNLIAPRSWTILHAPARSGFIRPDSTILVEGSPHNSTWRVIYPMTRRQVFIVGPELDGGYDKDFVESIRVDKNTVGNLNRRLVRSAKSSVIAHSDDDCESLRDVIDEPLATNGTIDTDNAGLWGPLSISSR